jgi:hypothetical protein
MARAALRNSIQIREGQPGMHTITFVPHEIINDVHTATLLP